jgi:hypothetical protein
MKTYPNFNPAKQFNSPSEAIDYAKTQPDPIEAATQIVTENLECGEYGFAAEVCREIETLETETYQ